MTEITAVMSTIQAVAIWMLVILWYTGWDLEKIRAMIRKKKPAVRALLQTLRP